jgi:hypothetical protein
VLKPGSGNWSDDMLQMGGRQREVDARGFHGCSACRHSTAALTLLSPAFSSLVGQSD